MVFGWRAGGPSSELEVRVERRSARGERAKAREIMRRTAEHPRARRPTVRTVRGAHDGSKPALGVCNGKEACSLWEVIELDGLRREAETRSLIE